MTPPSQTDARRIGAQLHLAGMAQLGLLGAFGCAVGLGAQPQQPVAGQCRIVDQCHRVGGPAGAGHAGSQYVESGGAGACD